MKFRRGHYQRALEEVVQLHAHEWPKSWEGKNPLRGGGTFASMTPVDRVHIPLLLNWSSSNIYRLPCSKLLSSGHYPRRIQFSLS